MGAGEGDGKRNFFGNIDRYDLKILMKRYGIGFVMLGMMGLLAIISPTFRTASNLMNVLMQVSINGVMAMGMLFVITAGGIDLSVSSMLALSSVTIGLVLKSTNSIVAACIAGGLFTTLFGLINGLVVAKYEVFPFVVTLASQLVIRGTAYIISGGYSETLANPDFKKIGAGKLFGTIPYPVIVLLVITIMVFILLHWTKFGRYIYSIGGNKNAATASGVNVFWTSVGSFVISGFCAGIAGIILTSRITAAQPNIGIGYETDAIAACVIGGASFSGGIGTVPGALMGIIIIGLIYNGMNLVGISSHWQTVVKGLLIVAAVLLEKFLNKKK